MEEEQPLHPAEEVVENLAENVSEVDMKEFEKSVAMEVEKNQDFEVHPTGRVETSSVEGVATNTNVPENEEIVILTDGEEEAEEVPLSEAVKPETAAIHTYQRRPAREETAEKRPEEELPRETPEQGIGGKKCSWSSSRRRRLIVDEEPEEGDDIFFHPIGEQHNQRQPDVHAGADYSDTERIERKRKGKAIANPVRKKLRQPLMAVAIQERDPSEVRQWEERVSDEEEARRHERRSKRKYDEARYASEQRPEMARMHFEKTRILLDNKLLGQRLGSMTQKWMTSVIKESGQTRKHGLERSCTNPPYMR